MLRLSLPLFFLSRSDERERERKSFCECNNKLVKSFVTECKKRIANAYIWIVEREHACNRTTRFPRESNRMCGLHLTRAVSGTLLHNIVKFYVWPEIVASRTPSYENRVIPGRGPYRYNGGIMSMVLNFFSSRFTRHALRRINASTILFELLWSITNANYKLHCV